MIRFLLAFMDSHEQQFQQAAVVRESALSYSQFSRLAMHGLERIGTVDSFTDLRRVINGRNQVLPMPALHPADGMEFAVPRSQKGIVLRFGIIDGGRSVNTPEIGRHHSAIFPGGKIWAATHQLNDARLDLALRIDGFDGVGTTGAPISCTGT